MVEDSWRNRCTEQGSTQSPCKQGLVCAWASGESARAEQPQLSQEATPRARSRQPPGAKSMGVDLQLLVPEATGPCDMPGDVLPPGLGGWAAWAVLAQRPHSLGIPRAEVLEARQDRMQCPGAGLGAMPYLHGLCGSALAQAGACPTRWAGGEQAGEGPALSADVPSCPCAPRHRRASR